MNKEFAAEFVGDGTAYVMGSFETVLARFYNGRMSPLVTG